MGKTIIIIIRNKIRTNSLQAKRHCVPSEYNSFLQNQNQRNCNSFLQNQNQSKCNSFQKEREIIYCFMLQIFPYMFANVMFYL